MAGSIERGFNSLIEHYVVFCLFLALFILTFTGVGNVVPVNMLGLILCAVGFTRRSVQTDLWVFVPLVIYNLFSMASSFAVYGNIVDGYASTQFIFPIMYLLMAGLSGREPLLLRQLCAVWAGCAAAVGIGRVVYRAVIYGSASRLDGFLGNPNAMGIFLVIGWFALLYCTEQEETGSRLSAFLPYIEPVVLAALALTLSMGSFAAMAVGVLALFLEQRQHASGRDAFWYFCRLLARASLGIGTGILIYLAAARTNVPWVCVILLAYTVAMVLCWKKYCLFLRTYPWAAAVISLLGVLVAAAAVVLRPSSAATFAERLEMMRSGLRYLTANPLLGVGPYRWRILDLYDGGKYFNTWHIHNSLLHVGVEMGWIAMVMLVLIVVRFYWKRARRGGMAGFTAYLFHNLMDTSFFYLGITSLVMLTTGEPRGKTVGGVALKVIFAVSAAIFAYDLFRYLLAAA